ncbi:D-Ala-D-Ala carboxypeptidase family metallohydrolase [Hellea balneolensis]|uniref:D-Ala-D-Ala carboxypeptidase family metallohydrolase n=1 Tax=Hellea balneolensis TaxID=287478 RepID=UPI001F47870A|nr:D-Ala-D-Ala carboxypeptidase family metallohydrolase [Hellea balneolensis]
MAHQQNRDIWPWPSFSQQEMSCRHCGELYVWPDFMDRLQGARNAVGRPFIILSAHRCSLHNARVGGAPLSQHLKLAADIAVYGHDKATLLQSCRYAGFAGFGFYSSFLHVDLGRPRYWFGGQKAKDLWQIYLD